MVSFVVLPSLAVDAADLEVAGHVHVAQAEVVLARVNNLPRALISVV